MKTQVVIDESNPDNAGCQPGLGLSHPGYVGYRGHTVTIRNLTLLSNGKPKTFPTFSIVNLEGEAQSVNSVTDGQNQIDLMLDGPPARSKVSLRAEILWLKANLMWLKGTARLLSLWGSFRNAPGIRFVVNAIVLVHLFLSGWLTKASSYGNVSLLGAVAVGAALGVHEQSLDSPITAIHWALYLYVSLRLSRSALAFVAGWLLAPIVWGLW